MSGWCSTAVIASPRWAAAWADSSSAVSYCSRWTARIEAAQAWMVFRQAARVVSRALCLLSSVPRAHSPAAWISSTLDDPGGVTRSAYGRTGLRAGCRRRCRRRGRHREVADLGLPLGRQPLQPAEADQVGGESRDDQAVQPPRPELPQGEGAAERHHGGPHEPDEHLLAPAEDVDAGPGPLRPADAAGRGRPGQPP